MQTYRIIFVQKGIHEIGEHFQTIALDQPGVVMLDRTILFQTPRTEPLCGASPAQTHLAWSVAASVPAYLFVPANVCNPETIPVTLGCQFKLGY